ncbi:MAG TPA: hypothetical protein VEO01_16555 [Pseudonocardiaceae bacterium]|nr:hypothetical protein [Pseudonocardiaceae bacterium]
MRRRDFGRVLTGGLVLAAALPSNLPSIEELLTPERHYWFGWRATFRDGQLIMSEKYYKSAEAKYHVAVHLQLDDWAGRLVARREVQLYTIPLGESGSANIEVWKHDGWYYGVLNDQVRGMERIPTKQEMRRLA